MYLLLKSYSCCSTVAVYMVFILSLVCKVTKQSGCFYLRNFCFYLRVVVYVEPDISVLVLILCLVCKLNPSHLKVMMMLSMKFFSFPISTSLTKFTCYSTWYIKYIYENIKPGPHFMSGLYIASRPSDIHDEIIYDITFPYLQAWLNLNVAVHL